MSYRILSGFRPTGKIHLGNIFGALQNWKKLQEHNQCFFEIADYHALTTNYDKTENLKDDILNIAADWLAFGLDPKKAVIFVQSDVRNHVELFTLLSMITPLPLLERNPTLKEQLKDLNIRTIHYGHLGYPVLQAADILIYRSTAVPVGEDQLPHIELTREIARRFNNLYGETFPEPKALLTSFPRVPGPDGKRMSKSLNNTILLNEKPGDIQKKVKQAFTDPQKIRKNDKGHPDKCVVFSYHKIFNPENVEQKKTECKEGTIGCVDCKAECSSIMAAYLEPYRKKREALQKNEGFVRDVLREGAQKAREETNKTMEQIRSHMKLWV
ncbi:MAG: tryptophan--tRNA ligase [Candidatus Cloacimonadota bacterium]|nr:MAG: tryptophan--tRNA ligase [Candidatus Cloacimonadota bacterium]